MLFQDKNEENSMLNQTFQKSSALLNVWNVVRDELGALQDQMSGPMSGHVLNPVNNSIYVRDTAFAAHVFATEYYRTRDDGWRSRAELALNALHKNDVYMGVDEPIWNRFGWHFNKGSMATTGMLLDPLWEAENLLGIRRRDQEKCEKLIFYIKQCDLGNGLFAHDAVKPGSTPPPVQNTAAMALYLLSFLAKKPRNDVSSFVNYRFKVYDALKKGQRSDGFWPYLHPGTKQKLYDDYRIVKGLANRLTWAKSAFLKSGDASIYFGDAVHHCLTFYYTLKSVISDNLHNHDDMLYLAWTWIKQNLVETSEGFLRFNFDWEPKPHLPRYCNFRETSTYFLILGSLPLLEKQGVVKNDEAIAIANKLLLYIQHYLLRRDGVYPSVEPYEGAVEILRNILPRVGESVAWKASCLAHLVLATTKSE